MGTENHRMWTEGTTVYMVDYNSVETPDILFILLEKDKFQQLSYLTKKC